jgi:hypothetical protein
MHSEEIRHWTLLIFASVGVFITIKNFMSSISQRKIDNTYKTLDFLRTHIQSQQVETFIKLFHANNSLTGVEENEFQFSNGHYDTIEYMFTEKGCGNGDIQNMIELFNLISPTMDTVEKEIIWYEYGQIMNKLYQWTDYLEKQDSKNPHPEKYEKFYAQFNKFMSTHWKKMLFKPTKYYTYAE